LDLTYPGINDREFIGNSEFLLALYYVPFLTIGINDQVHVRPDLPNVLNIYILRLWLESTGGYGPLFNSNRLRVGKKVVKTYGMSLTLPGGYF